MTDSASPTVSPISFPLPIPLLVAISLPVSQWAAMVDKLDPHGPGSTGPVSLLEEASEMVNSVSITPWSNVLTTFPVTLFQTAEMLSKFHQNARAHVRPIKPSNIAMIRTLPSLATDSTKLSISRKTSTNTVPSLLPSLSMKTSSPILAVSTSTLLDPLLVATQSKPSVGVPKTASTTGSV